MSKRALITGITGQDGAYLAKFLLDKGYKVHGIARWDAVDGTERLISLKDQIQLHNGDVTDANNVTAFLQSIKPDEIYHLAALSHVGMSFETPASVMDINLKGSLHIFEAVRILGLKTRIYQASSSEMFGSLPAPQNEETKMEPCSPYGVAKLAAYHLAKIYRDAYGMFISNGILFNHESPMRGGDFVTKKIARAAARGEPVTLGNLEARRDWGHAEDYVRGMWMMLQHDEADDFVLASGDNCSVREFAEKAFIFAGIKIKWKGKGKNEKGIDAQTGKVLITIDERLYRPKEVHDLRGDASKARAILGWKPEISFTALVGEMVEAERNKQEAAWQKAG